MPRKEPAVHTGARAGGLAAAPHDSFLTLIVLGAAPRNDLRAIPPKDRLWLSGDILS